MVCHGTLRFWQIRRCRHAAPWARVANFVKKPPLIVNVTYLKINGFNASMWVSWSPSDPKKSQCINRCIQIHQICIDKHGYDIHIKFEVSLHFWAIWPTVCRPLAAWPRKCLELRRIACVYCDCRMYYYLERLIEKRKDSQKSTQLAIESIYLLT